MESYLMDNKYCEYLRLPRSHEFNILRSICVHPQSKIIYFKPGKVAGTSIFRKVLQPMGGWVIIKDNPLQFNEWLQNITDDELESYFKFIFVRNPFDRLISAWNDISRSYYPDFKEFVYDGIFDENGNPRKLHYQLQSSLIETPVGYGLGSLFIGKLENLQGDWKELCGILDIPHQVLGKHSQSNHEHYTTYYDDETKNMVSQLYKRDFELFDYKTEVL